MEPYENNPENEVPAENEAPVENVTEAAPEQTDYTYHGVGAGQRETVGAPEYSTQTDSASAEPAAPEAEPASEAAAAAETQTNTNETPHASRAASPYADSPYVTGSAPRSDAGYDVHYGYQYKPQEQKPKKQRRARRPDGTGGVWKKIVAAVLVLAAIAGGCGITGYIVNKQWEERSAATVAELNEKIDALSESASASSSTGSDSTTTTVSSGDTLTPGQVYAQNVDSVVTVECTVTTRAYGQTSTSTSSGSGFIITSDGYIVTNYHVIEDASEITITLHDGTEYTATVKGQDSTNDVAVLKVEATDLPAVTLGSSDELEVGDMVVAIGNPLGTLDATQTVGYVCGTNREVTTDNTVINMIQTDAAINPGNSGGPLFNMKGEVVGITTAKYSGTTSSGASIEGIGFAIPIDDVQSIIGDLQTVGYVTGAYLGITVTDVDEDAISNYGVPSGAYVYSVVEDGAADKAGVQAKDIITAIGDIEVSSRTELTRALRSFKAGDVTTLTVYRSGETLTLTITLDERPADLDSDSSSSDSSDVPSEGDYDEWYEYFRRYFGGEGG